MTSASDVIGPITLGVFVGLPVAFWGAFKALEEAASQPAKSALANWLTSGRMDKDLTSTFESVISRTLESVFGFNIVSKKFIVAALWFSFFGAAIFMPSLLFIVITADKEVANDIAMEFSKAGGIGAYLSIGLPIAKMVVGFLLGAFICDWLSLAKSVLLISSARANGKIAIHYVVDVSISLFMALGWIVFWIAIVVLVRNLLPDRGMSARDVNNIQFLAVPTIVTSLLPSLLLLLFVLAAFLGKLLSWLFWPVEFLRSRVLDVLNKPFMSLGMLLATVTFPFSTLALIWLAKG